MAPPPTHPALGACAFAGAALSELTAANLWSLADREVLALREQLEALESQLAAARLAATREITIRGAAIAAGATSTAAWLMAVVRLHPGAAIREERLANRLADLPATSAGLASGAVTVDAAQVIADTDLALAVHATAAQRGDAEALLAEQAGLLDHKSLVSAAVHLRHVLDPDHGQRVARDEQEQVARRYFRLRAQPDGSARAEGYLGKEAAATLRRDWTGAAAELAVRPVRPGHLEHPARRLAARCPASPDP